MTGTVSRRAVTALFAADARACLPGGGAPRSGGCKLSLEIADANGAGATLLTVTEKEAEASGHSLRDWEAALLRGCSIEPATEHRKQCSFLTLAHARVAWWVVRCDAGLRRLHVHSCAARDGGHS